MPGRATTPAAVERFDGSLRPLSFPALVRYLGRHAATQVGQQRRRIRPIAPHEASRPRPEPIVGIGVLAFKHSAKVDAIVCGIDEWVA
jgi:hypothetical protein